MKHSTEFLAQFSAFGLAQFSADDTDRAMHARDNRRGDDNGVKVRYTIAEDASGARGYATDGRVMLRTGTFNHPTRSYSLARLELCELALRLGWNLAFLDHTIDGSEGI